MNMRTPFACCRPVHEVGRCVCCDHTQRGQRGHERASFESSPAPGGDCGPHVRGATANPAPRRQKGFARGAQLPLARRAPPVRERPQHADKNVLLGRGGTGRTRRRTRKRRTGPESGEATRSSGSSTRARRARPETHDELGDEVRDGFDRFALHVLQARGKGLVQRVDALVDLV